MRPSFYGSEGREFESSAARHLKTRPQHFTVLRPFCFFRQDGPCVVSCHSLPFRPPQPGRTQEEIERILRDDFGIAIGNNFHLAQPPQAYLDIRGKEILRSLGINANDVVQHIEPKSISEDLRVLVEGLVGLTG